MFLSPWYRERSLEIQCLHSYLQVRPIRSLYRLKCVLSPRSQKLSIKPGWSVIRRPWARLLFPARVAGQNSAHGWYQPEVLILSRSHWHSSHRFSSIFQSFSMNFYPSNLFKFLFCGQLVRFGLKWLGCRVSFPSPSQCLKELFGTFQFNRKTICHSRCLSMIPPRKATTASASLGILHRSCLLLCVMEIELCRLG